MYVYANLILEKGAAKIITSEFFIIPYYETTFKGAKFCGFYDFLQMLYDELLISS